MNPQASQTSPSPAAPGMAPWQVACLHADPAQLDQQASQAAAEILLVPTWRPLEVDWGTLREGIDRLAVSGRNPKEPWFEGLYVGRWRGQFPMVLPDVIGVPVVVNPFRMHEPRPLPSSVNWEEWHYGFMCGVDQAVAGDSCGHIVKGNVPTDFDRGFSCGYRLACDHRIYWHPQNAFNEQVRRLAAAYPKEHWVGVPS